jgi:hypothetical protein
MAIRNEQPHFQAKHHLIHTQRPVGGACGGTPNTFWLDKMLFEFHIVHFQ